MKQNIGIIILAGLFGIFASCTESEVQVRGEGETIKKAINISDFESINMNSNIDVVFSQGNTYSVELEAQENIMRYIDVYTIDGGLNATIDKEAFVRPTKPVTLHVQMPEIRSIVNSGSGDISCVEEGLNKVDKLSIIQNGIGNVSCNFVYAERIIVRSTNTGNVSLNGKVKDLYTTNNSSGNIKFEGNAINTRVEISGSGDTHFSGFGTYQEIVLKGTGEYFGSEFVAQKADVTVNGAGSAEINVVEKLNAWINGTGNIVSYGDPEIELENHGNGSFIKANE
ncbi:MAG TPA: head GIN domain-containing protein [Bacteroidales bacterium]|nr:head GIN domain-containing protein [Bacteroidales bacterium]